MMKISSLPSKLSLLLFLTGLALAANPLPAWALQAHAGPEGLYVHQGAHIFLAFAMLIFAVNIQRSPLVRQKAWRLLATSAILFILWNIWAFIGHLSFFARAEASFIMEPGHITPSLPVTSWPQALYYLLKMDHLLCLPALFFFYFGLKEFLAESTDLQSAEGDRQS